MRSLIELQINKLRNRVICGQPFSVQAYVNRKIKTCERDGMMINWRVRFRNKNWVIAFVSQLMIVTQMILGGLNLLGITDFQLSDAIQESILTLVNAVFVLLSMLGIVQDPTTKGYGDSERAMNYKDPN